MPLQLKEVSTDAEFARVMEALFDAYSYPYDGFWVICKGSSEQECVSRFNKWRKQDPNAHWIYVTDTETDEVVGATQWNIYESSPSEDPRSELQGDWLEEGSVLRNFVEEALNNHFAKRQSHMNRPHFLVCWCGTRVNHRRRGIGRMMLQWGTDRADKLGISCFVEAAERAGAVPMYRSVGFVSSHKTFFDASPDKPDPEWQACRREYHMPMIGYLMWRPVGGKWVDGETQFPWTEEGG